MGVTSSVSPNRKANTSSRPRPALAASGISNGSENGNDSAERILHRERGAYSYARSLILPTEVEQSEAGAKLELGVLNLRLPKRGARAAAQITVD